MLAALLLLLPAPASGSVKLEALLGYHGLHKFQAWTPLQIRLENSEAEVEGVLEVRAPRGNVYRGDAHVVLYSRPVKLPPLSRRTFDFAVFVENLSSKLEVSFRSSDGDSVSRRFDLRENLITGDFIIALSREPLFDFLANELGPYGAVVHPRLERLPGRMEGYDGVRAVIIHDADISSLRKRQVHALKAWTAIGGRLIITGGPGGAGRFSLMFAPRFFEKPGDIKTLKELSDLGRKYGAPVVLPAPLPITPLDDVPGERMLSEGATPLIVKKRWGRGEVVLVAFDPLLPVFTRWQGFDALWEDIIRGAKAPPLHVTNTLESGLGREALKGSVVPFPPLWLAAIFFGAYFVVYLLFRRAYRGRGIYWLAVTGIVAAFALSAEVVFHRAYLPDGYLEYRFATLELFPEAGLARKETGATIFSSRARVVRGKGPYVNSMVEASAPESYRERERDYNLIYKDPSELSVRMLIKPWSALYLRMLEVVEFPLKIKVFALEGRVYIDIYNNSTHELTGGRLIMGGRILKLKDTAAGERLKLDVSKESMSTATVPLNLEKSAGGPLFHLKKKMLEGLLAGANSGEAGDKFKVIFSGWLKDDPGSGFSIEEKHRGLSLTLVWARLEI